jgi:hypothetical protein
MRRRQFLAVAAGLAGSGCLSLQESTPTGTRPGPAPVTESGEPELVQVTTDAEAVEQWSLDFRGIGGGAGGVEAFAIATDSGVHLYGYDAETPQWEAGETADWKGLALSGSAVYAGGGFGSPGEGGAVYRYDRDSGELDAQREFEGRVDSLDFFGDLLVCTSHVETDSGASSYLTRVRGLDPDSLTDQWVQEYGTDVFAPGVARVDGTIHLGFDNFFLGLGASDGSQQYRAPIRVGNPVAHDGALLADADGQLRRVDPETLEYAWSVGEEVMGRPVVVEDVVAVPTTDGVLGASVTDGEELWSRTLEDTTGVQPEALAYHGGVFWVGAADETLYGLLPETGETAFALDADVTWIHGSSEGVVVAASNTLTVYTVDA